MKILLLICAVACSIVTLAKAAPTKTKLSKSDEAVVESSETDFILSMISRLDESGQVRVFELSAPQPGRFTLLCFINGTVCRRDEIDLPGKYQFGLRGLAPGEYRITLQVVDANGRVGHATERIHINKRVPLPAK